MLPGWCCIANRHIGAGERRQLIPHVRLGSISGAGKSNSNEASHVRASSFQLYMLAA